MIIRLFDTNSLYQKTQEIKGEPRILYLAKLTFKYKEYKLLSTQEVLFPWALCGIH